MNKKCCELFEKAKRAPKNIRFAEIGFLCECIGVKLERIRGSHHIYRSGCPFFLISLQKMKDGKAKPYQVRQLGNFIEENNLISKE
ncbi:MAG TPA: type II toxin-antitoxin system HicA family toxin [Acidobacteriota bacterium]